MRALRTELTSRAALANRFGAACICFLLLRPVSVVFAQYHIDSWTTDNGLPHNSVRDILQTRDGYLWLATADGLVRFDGVRFTTFNRENSPGMTGNRITALFEDNNGDLWMGSDGSLMRVYHGAFTGYGSASGIPNAMVGAIAPDPSHYPLILLSQCVMRWHKGRLDTLNTGSFPNAPVGFRVIHYPEPAGFWSQNAQALDVYVRGRLISWNTRQEILGVRIRAVAEDEQGTFWAAGTGKLFRNQNGRLTPVPIPSGCSPAQDLGFIAAPKLNVVCYGPGLPLVRSATDGTQQQTLIKSLPQSLELHQPTAFYQDREGILWIGTATAGLWRVRKEVVATLSEPEGLRDHNVYPIYQDRAGAIWVGAWPNTLNRYDGGKFSYFTERDGLVPYISALYEDRSGALWVGAYGSDRHDPGKEDGLRIFKNGRFVAPADLRGLGTVRAMLQDRHRALWLGCEDKLVQYANGVVRTFTTRDGLATNYATVLVEDRSGDLWIGGQGGLTRLSRARFTAYTVRDGLPSPTVRALYVDRENVLWIGTYDGGLARFENGQFTRYTTRDGLFSSGVFQILEDSRGYFWISSNQGIYRVRKGELNDFARGKTGSITSIAYGKPDGMRNIESNGGHWPAGIRARDGKLWFPTQDGVAIIDPGQVPINIIPPPVVIESCLVEGRPVPFDKPVGLSPTQTSFEIRYTAFSFASPERIHFKYKLDGLDRDWIDAGSRRTAYYSHLPPGDYSFKVIAANSDGVWNMQGTHLLISVLPPFYRTWWFVSLMILAGAGAVVFGWQYRVSQLQRAYAAQQAFSRQLIASQERERKRIAGELHDSLGQSLVLIRNWARLGSSQLNPQSPAREELDEITATAAQAIHDVREIAYNLGPYHLDRLGLANTLKDMIHRVAQASAIRFTTQLDRLPGPLPREVEMNLFRIAQEAVNNIVKHSGATEATLAMQQEADSVILLIKDNGKGFHPPAADSSPGQRGFGLTGMEERVRLLNGMWAVRSAPGQGTTIEITLKAGNGDETASDSDRG